MIITPSTGVFAVDEDLTKLTKERLIDNGKYMPDIQLRENVQL